MTLNELLDTLTIDQANAWANTSEKTLFVDYDICGPANIYMNDFVQTAIEEKFEAMLKHQSEVIEVIRTVYNSCLKDIEEATRFLKGMRSTLLGQGHIVQQADGFQAIKSVTNGGKDFETTMAPWKAARWDQKTAEHNAAIIKDGADKPYRAIHVVDATEEHLTRTNQILDSLTSGPFWPIYAKQMEQDLTENVNWVGHPAHY